LITLCILSVSLNKNQENVMAATTNRRTFLKTAGLGAASVALTGADAPAASNPKARPDDVDRRDGVELAIATICVDGFGNEYFEPSFELLPQTGFKNVEFNVWYPRTVTPAGIDSIRERCYENGLTPISLQGSSFGGDALKDVTHKLWLMEKAKELGCRRVKFTGAGRGEAGGLDRVITVLEELAPAAEEMDVLICVENHRDNNIETIEDYERIFDAVDSSHVGICLDTGHFAGSGIRNLDVVERFPDRINHVDLKDTVEFGTYETVNYGSGAVDLDAVTQAILDHGYSGYLVIEQAPPIRPDHLLEDLQRAHDLFAQYER
jgi:sugar phosphate isomerase/epimerase